MLPSNPIYTHRSQLHKHETFDEPPLVKPSFLRTCVRADLKWRQYIVINKGNVHACILLLRQVCSSLSPPRLSASVAIRCCFGAVDSSTLATVGKRSPTSHKQLGRFFPGRGQGRTAARHLARHASYAREEAAAASHHHRHHPRQQRRIEPVQAQRDWSTSRRPYTVPTRAVVG